MLPRHTLSIACLQSGYDAAVAVGSTPRMLILTNPGNPTGTCFAEAQMLEAVEWAREHALHIVVDEVYASGVHYSGSHSAAGAGDAVPFRSALQWLPDAPNGAPTAKLPEGGCRSLGEDVHIVWGFSKDWGVSGFRIGVLFSQNTALNSALNNISYFCAVSNFTQEAMAEVLEDVAWSRSYMRDNASVVGRNFTAALAVLHGAGIPCMHADGGMYVWVDLRRALPKLSGGSTTPSSTVSGATICATEHCRRALDVAGVPWAAEAKLGKQLFEEEKVLLTPGRACCSAHAGFFRICVTWMSPEGTLEGVRRVAKVFQQAAASSAVQGCCGRVA